MKEWDDIWKTAEGRALWLRPEHFVVSLLPRLRSEGVENVLDLGFGLGRHTVLLAKEGFEVYGIDSSPAGLEYATEWSQRQKIALKLTIGEMSHLPFDDDLFDLVVAWNVIYHGTADYIRRTMSEIRRCTKPNGYLACTLISTRHVKHGLGQEIEEDTFVIAEDEEKRYPHHYFDREDISRYLDGFVLLHCEDTEQSEPGTYHWQILARLESKSKEV
jgi:tellurite methyltransferase